MTIDKDVVILGGGVCGLAAAVALGDRAVVLERDERPGGLVKTTCFNENYWFDHVLHLLYFSNPRVESRIRALLGDNLSQLSQESWVETLAGTVRYPFQMHLGGLKQEVTLRCLHDLARVTFGPRNGEPANFEEMLLGTFGQAMCETFLFPYNQKVWKRPLNTLAPSGFQWTITHPDYEQVLRGALAFEQTYRAYNSKGWYPRPPDSSAVRGMEVLSRALAAKAHDVRLRHEVESIDLEQRIVHVRHGNELIAFRYRRACCSTVPLPRLLTVCRQTPEHLRQGAAKLVRNRVLNVALCVKGPRPEGCGHWRYYSDTDIVFTRFVFMHSFDPATAPPDGWGLMAEITERAEDPPSSEADVIAQVREDIVRAGALPAGCTIMSSHLLHTDPAYVVFTTENNAIMEEARAFFKQHDVFPLGRYGRWEYSSMSQVMSDGFDWAEEIGRAEGQ